MDYIHTFGKAIDRLAQNHPDASRRLLLAGLRAFRLKLSRFPDRRLPGSRQFSAVSLNRTVCSVLSHPEQAALVSIFQPCELLEAMDILPMCAELFAAFLTGADAEGAFAEAAETAGIAETYCSYHKVLLGSAFLGMLPPPRLIVNTSLVCDANQLTFRTLSDSWHIPQFYVDVPPQQNEDSVLYVADELRDLKVFLEDHLHKQLDPNRLEAVLTKSRDTVQAFRDCLPERAAHSLPTNLTSEMYELYLTHNALGTEDALRYARSLLSELQSAPQAHGLRLFWLHTMPFWQKPARSVFDPDGRCQIIGCDMALESLCEVDPAHPYESMARRLVYSPWNGGKARVQAAVEMAQALHADGVVCFCHWGCKQTMGLSALFKRELEAAGFPTLILNGDGCDRRNASDGQTATRLNAFIEMLEAQNG